MTHQLSKYSKAHSEPIDLEGSGCLLYHTEVFQVVDDFYHQVQGDELLSVPFQSVHDWPEHIERLTHFWWVRLGGDRYLEVSYNPVMKHYQAGFNREYLVRWLELFHGTIDRYLGKPQAELWKLISAQMGEGLSLRNEYYKKEIEEFKSSFRKVTRDE